MRPDAIPDTLSKRAPQIAIATFCAALLCAWLSAPLWLSNSIAIIVAALAVLLLLTKGRLHHLEIPEDPDSTTSKSRIAYELAGKGSPPGSYILAFFGFLTIMLTGMQLPIAAPAWAGFALVVVWAFVNARYPAEDELER